MPKTETGPSTNANKTETSSSQYRKCLKTALESYSLSMKSMISYLYITWTLAQVHIMDPNKTKNKHKFIDEWAKSVVLRISWFWVKCFMRKQTESGIHTCICGCEQSKVERDERAEKLSYIKHSKVCYVSDMFLSSILLTSLHKHLDYNNK